MDVKFILVVVKLILVLLMLILSLYILFTYRKMKRIREEFMDKSIVNDRYVIRNTVEQIHAGADHSTADQLIDSHGIRKLSIQRTKSHYASLLKIYVFIEADNFADDCLKITMDGYQYKQIGSIANGKTISVDVPNTEVRMLVSTRFRILFCRIPIYIKRFDISEGNEDIALSIETISPIDSISGVQFLFQQKTK